MYCLTTPVYSRRKSRFVNSEFPNKKIWPKYEVYLWKTNLKANICKKFYVSSKQDKEWYKKTTSYLEQPSRHFCQHFIRRTTQQSLLALNLASRPKTTKLYFSSPFKPLRCCLRSDKLVNCQVRKFCKDLFLNSHVIWSVNQIVLFDGFLSDFVEIISCVYTKTIILFNLGE